MLKRLVLKNLLLLSLFGVAFTGCGQKEDSIPYKAPQGAEPLPKGLLPKIDVLSKNPTNTSTSSSRAIRQETIGLNVDINYTSKDRKKADISVIVSYSEAPGTCSQAIYKTKDVDTIILDKPEKKIKFEGFGTAQCLEIENGICKYLFLTIQQTPSSLANAKSGIIPASVFAVLKNKSTSPAVDKFIPMISENEKLLQLPQSEKDFQYCIKPQVLLVEDSMNVLYVMDPTSGLDLNQYNIRNDFDFRNGFF